MSAHNLAEALRLIAWSNDSAWQAQCAREALAAHEAEQQAGEAVAWHVVDADGQLMHAAGWKEAAHEHINDALNEYGIAEAAKWRVIPVFTHPQQPLTREQCIKLWGDRSDGPSNGEIVSFTRAIEAAHGITKDTK